MKETINVTAILAARIIRSLELSEPIHITLDRMKGGVCVNGLSFSNGQYWSEISGEKGRLLDVLASVKARLLPEETKRINGSPTGTEVWTVP